MPGTEVTTAGSRALSAELRRFLGSAHFQKLWRYMAVSVITTVLTLVLLYVFYRGLQVGGKTGVTVFNSFHISSAELSNVLATGVSTIPSYTLNRKWAWGKSGPSHIWREVVPFWVIAIVSLVLSTVVVGVASREAVHLSSRREVQTILVEIGNLATYGAMWIAKYALFNKVLFKGGERAGRVPLHLRRTDGAARTEAHGPVAAHLDGAPTVNGVAAANGASANGASRNGSTFGATTLDSDRAGDVIGAAPGASGNGASGNGAASNGSAPLANGNGRGARNGDLRIDSLSERSIGSAADAG